MHKKLIIAVVGALVLSGATLPPDENAPRTWDDLSVAEKIVVGLLSLTPLGLVGCSSAPTRPPTSPPALVTVSAGPGDGTYQFLVTTQEELDQAIAAFDGGPANIPSGEIVWDPGNEVNAPWSWRVENVSFAEVTIELCDGNPQLVEDAGPHPDDATRGYYGDGSFCPWDARVTRIEAFTPAGMTVLRSD